MISAHDIEDAIKRVEAEAPPLSDDQAHKVAVLLSTGKPSVKHPPLKLVG